MTVTVLVLVLLATSVALLTYKIMKLRKHPEIWREYQQLLRQDCALNTSELAD